MEERVEKEEHVEMEEPKREEYSCFYCNESGSCPYAWDDYNLDSCLAGK